MFLTHPIDVDQSIPRTRESRYNPDVSKALSTVARGTVALLVLAACRLDTIESEGELGRPIALASGDELDLPRLLLRNEPCPGSAGGCSEVCTGPPESCAADACVPLLIDTASPITVLADDSLDVSTAERTCFEVRPGENLLASELDAQAQEQAVTRFRFDSVPVLRLPSSTASPWDWAIGTSEVETHVGGILGGNVLRNFAVRILHRRDIVSGELLDYQVALSREFPGSEETLADRGRAFLPVQFPGRLLGKEITDVCTSNGENCDFVGAFEIDNQREQSALLATRMLLDSCISPPPAAVTYNELNNTCQLSPGKQFAEDTYLSATGRIESGSDASGCDTLPSSDDAEFAAFAGKSATLMVATGVPGLVVFRDSALRMFGGIEQLPLCSIRLPDVPVTQAPPACYDGELDRLEIPGWPAATGLQRLKVRSVALVEGLTTTAGPSPCKRLESRMHGLREQCAGALRSSDPNPLPVEASCVGASATSAAVMGEVSLPEGDPTPDPARWITATVVPETHPMVEALRRDISPDALQLDGLIGTALFDDTDVVLDYTDESPGVRMRCLNPDSGKCLAMPMCSPDTEDPSQPVPRCCQGLPRDLIVDLIRFDGLYSCCAALSEPVRQELNNHAERDGLTPPCPQSNDV